VSSIIKKKIKNHIYYYYVESKRIDGKPKYVNQVYLGTAEKILEKYKNSGRSSSALYSNISDFGDVTLLYDIALRLGVVKTINEVVGKRNQGVTPGMYILTAAINRAVAPTSKSGLQDWMSKTVLPYNAGIKPALLTPQNFWNNTGLSEDMINKAEDAIVKSILEQYDLDTMHLIYDATNFFTFIDTMQPSDLAKRGHSKEKRNDLRIIGLSMMITPDHSIPLLHEAYPGNRPDAKQFCQIVTKMKSRYEKISGKKSDVTIVFDRGNNSEDNIDLLEEDDFPFHYVGGLKKQQSKELYLIPHSQYTILDVQQFPDQSAYRTKYKVFERELTVVIVHNPALENGQLQGIYLNIAKTEEKLKVIQAKLLSRADGNPHRGRKQTAESIAAQVKTILSTEYMGEVFCIEIGMREGSLFLDFLIDEAKLEQIRIEELGKTVLFTDRHDFTNEEIIGAYRSAWHVEDAFKQLKNSDHLAVRPVFHWTDDKIRVHIFSCVLAFRLCCLLERELALRGIDVSINQMLDSMKEIKQVMTFFGDINKPEVVQTYSHGNALAERILSEYNLVNKYGVR
jgi:transposase